MKFILAVTALAALFVAANAGIMEVGLGIDSSGSINDAQWNLQINAYADVLSNSTILPRNNTVAVGIWFFGTIVIEVFPTTVINSTTYPQMMSALTTTNRTGGLTAIGDCILAIAKDLTTNNIDGVKQLIDISTDGLVSEGVSSSIAADQAVAQGVDEINCLAIEGPVTILCGFVRGPDSFSAQAVDFADTKATLADKLSRELSQDPDCQNGGTRDVNGDCVCKGSWTGLNCEVCSVSCINNGTLNNQTCACECPQPFAGATCSEDCGNVWSDGKQFEPEDWQFSGMGMSLKIDSGAFQSLNGADASGGTSAMFTIAPDGDNVYVGGGLNDLNKPFLNNLKRYSDGSLFYFQRIDPVDVGLSGSVTFGEAAVSHDGQNVYAIVVQHTCSDLNTCTTAGTAYVAYFSRDTANKGRLTYQDKYQLSNVLTDRLVRHSFFPRIHLKVSPDDRTVLVAANKDNNPASGTNVFRPQLLFFRRDANVTDAGETCPEAWKDYNSQNFKVDMQPDRPQCPMNYSTCVKGVCSDVDFTGGQLTYLSAVAGTFDFDGYTITDVHMSFDSEYVYVTSEGYLPLSARSAYSAPLRGASIHLIVRTSDTAWSLNPAVGGQVLTIAPNAGATNRRSLRMFMSPNDRFVYLVWDRQDGASGDRVMEVRTRSLLDGRLSFTPIILQRLGTCDYDSVWHPVAMCATKRYLFLHSKRAGIKPEGVVSVPPVYNQVETQQEMFFWDHSCPLRNDDLWKFLRYADKNEDPSGMFTGATSVSCADDYAYMRKDNGEIVHLHVAPRNLEYLLKAAATEVVYEVFRPIDPLVPSVKGGTVLSYIITPELPIGLSIDNATGIISGTAVLQKKRTVYTVTANHRMGFSTTTEVALTIVEDTTDICPPIPNTQGSKSFGFGLDIDSAWWWLLWGLLALLLCLLCCIYRLKKQYKKKEAILLQQSVQNVHHYHNEDGEEERQEIEMAPVMPLPSRKDRVDAVNKGVASQLRLKSTGDKDIFIFGTRRVQMSIISDKLMVRVGGGWMPCEKFVQKNARAEARKMGLDASNLSFDRVGEDMQKAERQIRRNMAGGSTNRISMPKTSSEANLRGGDDETYLHHPSMSMDNQA